MYPIKSAINHVSSGSALSTDTTDPQLEAKTIRRVFLRTAVALAEAFLKQELKVQDFIGGLLAPKDLVNGFAHIQSCLHESARLRTIISTMQESEAKGLCEPALLDAGKKAYAMAAASLFESSTALEALIRNTALHFHYYSEVCDDEDADWTDRLVVTPPPVTCPEESAAHPPPQA